MPMHIWPKQLNVLKILIPLLKLTMVCSFNIRNIIEIENEGIFYMIMQYNLGKILYNKKDEFDERKVVDTSPDLEVTLRTLKV